ncbi:MAG: aldo/keto reductase [Kocuria sp.]|nr:aldo/keto reductase [Kocuria sp.]
MQQSNQGNHKSAKDSKNTGIEYDQAKIDQAGAEAEQREDFFDGHEFRTQLWDQVGVADRRHTLRDGNHIPQIGLGTARMDNSTAEAVVYEALTTGFRLIDTAANYHNEAGVGRALKDSLLPREDVFVTTKLPGRDHGTHSVRESLEKSLNRLQLDWVDLYLIHWPNPGRGQYVESFRTMLELREEGLITSVGVSNFTPEMVDELIAATGEAPAVNQVELQPQYQQEPLRAHHHEHHILVEAWAPLGHDSKILKHPWINEIATDRCHTPAQVVLRWHIQNGVLPIPKTTKTTRMAENLDVFGWELTDEQMHRMKLLHTGLSASGYNPWEHEEL